MRNFTQISLLFLASSLLTTCRNDATKFIIPKFSNNYEMKGDSIMTIPGCFFIHQFDTVLLFEKIYSKDNRFICYNSGSLKKLGSFGMKGRGPGEYINAFVLDAWDNENSNLYFWILDATQKQLKQVNLGKALVNQNDDSIIKNKTPIPYSAGYVFNAFILNSDSIIFLSQTHLSRYLTYLTKNNQISLSPSYPRLKYVKDNDLHLSFCTLTRSKSILVSAMRFFDRIDFINLKTGFPAKTIISQDYKKTKLLDIKSLDDLKINYFVDIKQYGDLIIILRHKQLISDQFKNRIPVEIWIFDEKANPIARIKINEYISSFVCDVEKNIIFGLDPINEVLYKYDISFLPDQLIRNHINK